MKCHLRQHYKQGQVSREQYKQAGLLSLGGGVGVGWGLMCHLKPHYKQGRVTREQHQQVGIVCVL